MYPSVLVPLHHHSDPFHNNVEIELAMVSLLVFKLHTNV